MNWKSVIAGVVTALLALAVWEMFVKNIVIKSAYEGYFEGDNFDYSEYKISA
jgi:hypothetical protein